MNFKKETTRKLKRIKKTLKKIQLIFYLGEPSGGVVENCGAIRVNSGKHIDLSCQEQFCGACNLSTLPKFRNSC